MSFDFSADEIFEIAEQIERNGAKFYREIAQKVTNPYKKQLLEDLASMEDDHEKTFKSLRSKLKIDEKLQTTFDPEGDSERYLKALADTRIFYEKEVDSNSMEEILKSAIAAEKDSIVFYLGIKDVVPENLGKQKLDEIIREEMNHISLLSKELLELNK